MAGLGHHVSTSAGGRSDFLLPSCILLAAAPHAAGGRRHPGWRVVSDQDPSLSLPLTPTSPIRVCRRDSLLVNRPRQRFTSCLRAARLCFNPPCEPRSHKSPPIADCFTRWINLVHALHLETKQMSYCTVKKNVVVPWCWRGTSLTFLRRRNTYSESRMSRINIWVRAFNTAARTTR